MSQRTLLLNGNYQPLAVVPLRRAVILVLAEKAEVLEEDGEAALHAASYSLPIPKVIRLTRLVRVPYVRRVPVTRKNVLQRDHYVCAYCHGHADTMDHVTPKAKGGRHLWTNIVAACKRCNGKKGQRLLADLGWKLDFKPYEPAGTVALLVLVGSVDEAWEPWLARA